MTQGWRIEYEGAFFITFYLVAMKSRISLSMIKDENIETVLSRATGILNHQSRFDTLVSLYRMAPKEGGFTLFID